MRALLEVEQFETGSDSFHEAFEFETVTPSCACYAFSRCGETLDRFPPDVATVQPFHRPQIEQIAQCVVSSQASPNPIRFLAVVGHADPDGPEAYNLGLGLRRAEEVRRQLITTIDRLQAGLSSRISIAVETRGESQPIPGDNAKSRRVVVSIRTSASPPPPPPKPTGRCQLVVTSPGVLPPGVLNAPYAAALMAGKGVGAITWTIAGGSLPPAVTLGSNSGLISGTPTASGTYKFRVRARDAVGCTNDKDITVDIVNPGGPPPPTPSCDQGQFDKLKRDCMLDAAKCIAGRGAEYILQNLKDLPGALPCLRAGNPYAIALCLLIKGGPSTIDNMLRTHKGLQECRQRLDICVFNARQVSKCK